MLQHSVGVYPVLAASHSPGVGQGAEWEQFEAGAIERECHVHSFSGWGWG